MDCKTLTEIAAHSEFKTLAEIAAHLATAFAAVAAGLWFLFIASFRKRVQLDVQCSAFSDERWLGHKLVELQFLLENKGQVENHCYTLAYEIESVDHVTRHVLERSGNIVPEEAKYYYVRAGVTLRITARVWIPPGISHLRVKAFILYERRFIPYGRRRKEIDEKMGLFEQMYKHSDWTAIDRVFRLP